MASRGMTKRERLESAIGGAAPDRVPVALWRHFPVDDQAPASLAASTVAFQQQYDFDFVKVTPASSFCVKDWGADDEWRGATEGTRDYTRRVVHQPEDWAALARLDPRQGYLGAQLACLEHLQQAFGAEVPYIQTIFSPLSQARNLAGPENLAGYLRRSPAALKAALETITATTIDFVQAASATGIAGIFYAQQYASYRLLSVDEYAEFARPYDLRVLEAASDLWLNVLHLHGDEIMFDQAADYPVHIVNWHDRETAPSLAAGLQKIKGAVCGGIGRAHPLITGTPDEIRREAADAIEQTGGSRFVLGTGCVTMTNSPWGNIRAVREAVVTSG